MVNYEIPIEFKGFWDTETETIPLFEEVLRLAAMYDLGFRYTTIYCPEAHFVLLGECSFLESKVASGACSRIWRQMVLDLLVEASTAYWEKSRLIEIQTK